MTKKRRKSNPLRSIVRRAARAVKIFLAIAVLSTIYLYLPNSIRQKVVDVNPRIDTACSTVGFKVSLLVDALPVWGDEVRVPISDKEWEKLCTSVPKTKDALLLKSPGFVVGYSETMRNPLWVQYRLFDVSSFKRGKRPSRFKIDGRTTARVSHDDYTGSGYDRGHMAPNFGIATSYGKKGQLATFVMSNVIPQTPTVNQNVWKEIEMLMAKKYGRFLGEVLVITGPVFGRNPERLQNGVRIPEAYYKIALDHDKGDLRALAFLLPADSFGTQRLKTTLVSIDQLEQLTGINFFKSLSSGDEKQLEAAPAPHLWFALIDQFHYVFSNNKRINSQ